MVKSIMKYQWLSACRGLEIYPLDGVFRANSCCVSVSGDELIIGEKKIFSGEIGEILKNISPDLPVALTLTGKDVLIKKVEGKSNVGEDVIQQIFPNIKPQQFYVQIFNSGSNSYLAMVRREIVDGLLKMFSERQFRVLTMSLGPFPVSTVLDQINNYGQELVFDGHKIQRTHLNNWDDYNFVPGVRSPFPIKIDTEPLDEEFVLAYATAFQLVLFNKITPVALPTDVTDKVMTAFREEKKFRLRLAAVLVSAFLGLAVSVSLFNYYSSSNASLRVLASQNSAGVEAMRALEKTISSEEKLIKALGWNDGVRYAWLCDQIGQAVPPSVSLNEMTINPPQLKENPYSTNEVYTSGKIKIQAVCSDLLELNTWIMVMKNKHWVKQVVLADYTPTEDKNKQLVNINLFY